MQQIMQFPSRREISDAAMDETLRRAFQPVMSEVLPLRLRAAMDALRLKGSAIDRRNIGDFRA